VLLQQKCSLTNKNWVEVKHAAFYAMLCILSQLSFFIKALDMLQAFKESAEGGLLSFQLAVISLHNSDAELNISAIF